MPVKKSAAKALRQSKKRAYLNKRAKDNVKELAKKTRKAIEAGSNETQEMVKKTLKAIDKLAGRGILKKNTAARKKSRLMKKFNQKTVKKPANTEASPSGRSPEGRQNEQKREE